MTKRDNLQFRSKRERENEIDLARNYRDIAIPAIAAANQACRKSMLVQGNSRPAEGPQLIAAE